MRVETELSQVDNAQRVAGIPGLLKRRSATDLNVQDGETIVLAGLIQQQRSLDDSGLPGLSRIPAAGRLFGVRGKRNEDSEIVIFLTPRVERNGEFSAETEEKLRRVLERIETSKENRPVRPKGSEPTTPRSTARDGGRKGY
jgi:pilus assembly protein CpaC